MMKTAPHLPPPTCSVTSHHRWSNIRWFLVLSVIALASGATAALIVVDHWYPVGLGSNTGFILNRGTNNLGSIDPTIVREWRYRVLTLYDETKLIQGSWYTNQAYLGEMVIINAGGWAVAPLTPGVMIKPGTTVALDWQGERFMIERIVPDPDHELLFIKLNGSNFRATTAFAPRASLVPGRGVWGLAASDWQAFIIGNKEFDATGNHSLFVDPIKFSLRDGGVASRILLTDRGEFIGFSDARGHIKPVWTVEFSLPNIITKSTVLLARFDVLGTWVHGERVLETTKEVNGFYVSDIKTKDTGIIPLKRGDVIIKIQGESIDRERFVEQMITAPNEFMVTVIRNKKTIDLTIKK